MTSVPVEFVRSRDRRLNRLVKRSPERTLRRGEVLYDRGDRATDVFLVRSGHVCLTIPCGAGRGRRISEVAGPMEIFGLEALLPDASRRTGAEAGSDTVLVSLPGGEVFRTLQASRSTLAAVLRAQEEEMERVRRLAEGRRGLRAADRLGAVLLDLARRFGEGEGRHRPVGLRLTHRELADLAGIHRSTVTTLLNDWIYQGVLKEGADGLVIRKPRVLQPPGRIGRGEGPGRARG